MSNFLGTEHQEVLCGPEQIAEAFPAVLRHTEVPLLRTAPVPMFFLSRLVRENQGKVVLTGEGADELFAGYDIFKELALRDFIARVPESRYRPLLLRKLYPYLDRSPSRSVTYARSFFCADPAPFDARFRSHAPRWNMTSGIKQFYSGELARQADSPGACGRVSSFFREFETGCASDPLTFSQEIETRTLLPGYLLSSQGDRMMMANSVEGRFPFLDHRIVEFAFGLPPRFRLSGLLGKRVLRKAMSGHIPEKTRNMPKQPYRAPDARCFFAGKDSELVSRYLCDGDLRRKGYFDPESTGKLVRKCRAGKATGFRDNMAFVGILSVQILDDLFVNNREAAPDIPDRDLVIIDELSPSERNRGHQGENQWT
jgi:asparagine synthase (glutamine-hydrolysing)